jgi:hypothetical protein
MTPEQSAAFVNAAIARALIRAQGMTAENLQRVHREESVAYTNEAFEKLIDEEGIGSNSVILSFSI